LVHQLSLFLVGFNDLVQTSLQDHDGVRESSVTSSFITLFGLLNLLVFDLQDIIFILKLYLESVDLILELLFFFLVFSLEGDDLVIGLFGDFANSLIISVLVFGLLSVFLNLLGVSGALIVGTGQLFSKHVDLFPQSFIF